LNVEGAFADVASTPASYSSTALRLGFGLVLFFLFLGSLGAMWAEGLREDDPEGMGYCSGWEREKLWYCCCRWKSGTAKGDSPTGDWVG
jgi:hypothetical protein